MRTAAAGEAEDALMSDRGRRRELRLQMSSWPSVTVLEGHILMVLSYCGLFFLFGMADGLLGPTLIELSGRVSKPLQSMSWLFFFRDVGLLSGTLLGGFLKSRFEVNLIMAAFLAGNATSMAFLPAVRKYSVMLTLVLLCGVFLGAPDTCANVTLIKIFGKDVSPYIQGVHFFYGFGAFVSPLIARPFLRSASNSLASQTQLLYDRLTERYSSHHNVTGFTERHDLEEVHETTSLALFAYWIVSLCHIPVVLGMCWVYFRTSTRRGSLVKFNQSNEAPVIGLDLVPYSPEATFWQRIRESPRKKTMVVTLLCSVIIFLYEGALAMYGGYIYSFAVKSLLAMTSDQGAYLTSMYWGFFSLGRFASIFLAFVIPPKRILMGNVVGCLVSSIVLVAGSGSHAAVFTGTSMLGLFLSSASPTLISMSKHCGHFAAHATSVLVVSAALGGLTLPLMVGQLFDSIGSMVVPIAVLLISLLGFAAFCLVAVFDRDGTHEHVDVSVFIKKYFRCAEAESQATLQSSNYDPDSTTSQAAESQCISKPDIQTRLVQPKQVIWRNISAIDQID